MRSRVPCLLPQQVRALTDARMRERFQRGWRGRRGGEGCGAARDAAHGAARRCVSRRMCPHRLILLTTCLGVIVLVVTVLGVQGSNGIALDAQRV